MLSCTGKGLLYRVGSGGPWRIGVHLRAWKLFFEVRVAWSGGSGSSFHPREGGLCVAMCHAGEYIDFPPLQSVA